MNFKHNFLNICFFFVLLGAYFYININAQPLSLLYNQLSRVSSNTLSNHSIYFVTQSGIGSGQSITIDFPTQFVFGNNYDYTDMTLQEGDSSNCTTANFTTKTLAGTPNLSTWGATYTSNTVIFTSGTDTISANVCVKITLNSNGIGHTITNPNVTSNTVFNIDVSTNLENGSIATIILGDSIVTDVDQIILSANVNSTLLMGIDTVLDSCNNNSQTPPSLQSVNFGQLFPGEVKFSSSTIPFICIEAATNSSLGLKILVQSLNNSSDGALLSPSGSIISTTSNLNLIGNTTGYGLRVASLGTTAIGSFTASSPFNSNTIGDVGKINGLLASSSTLITSPSLVRSDSNSRIAIELAVKSDNNTPSDTYTDTLTFTAFTNL